jgi:hypothetical protein
LFDINTGSIPIKKCDHCKPVAEIMDAWTAVIPNVSEADLTGDFDESPPNHAICERDTLIGQEKAGCGGSEVKLIPSLKILLEIFNSGWVQGNQPEFAKLGQTNGQEFLIKIDVAAFKTNDFADPHSGNGHQAKKGVIGPGTHTC